MDLKENVTLLAMEHCRSVPFANLILREQEKGVALLLQSLCLQR